MTGKVVEKKWWGIIKGASTLEEVISRSVKYKRYKVLNDNKAFNLTENNSIKKSKFSKKLMGE